MADMRISCGAIVEREGEILLVKETKSPLRGTYGLPGGAWEPGETIETTALRETQEETGFNTKALHLVTTLQRMKPPKLRHIFAAEIVDGEAQTSKKHPEVVFFPLEQINELNDQNLLRGDWVNFAIQQYIQGVKGGFAEYCVGQPANVID